jgi:hypothetical protein
VTHFVCQHRWVGDITAHEDKVSPRKLVDGKELSSKRGTSETTRVTNGAIVDEDIGRRSTTNSHLADNVVGETHVVDIAKCPNIVFLTSGGLENELEGCIGPTYVKIIEFLLDLVIGPKLGCVVVSGGVAKNVKGDIDSVALSAKSLQLSRAVRAFLAAWLRT